MFTSHYGPRQGIYQSMDSFRSPNWRASQLSVLNEVYRHKANGRVSVPAKGRVSVPPNSFPARSLTKFRSTSLSQLPTTTSSIRATPSKPRPTSAHHKSTTRLLSFNTRPSPRMTLLTSTRKVQQKSSSPEKLDIKPESKQSQLCSRSLVSAPVKMHPRPSCKSASSSRPRHKPANFPYPDPTQIKGDQLFASRLVALARLEYETVQQEAMGHWTYQSTLTSKRPSSSCSIPSISSSSGTQQSGDRRMLSGRPKSAKTIHRTKLQHKNEHRDMGPRDRSTEKKSVSDLEKKEEISSHSQFDLSSAVTMEDTSTSDLGLSIDSLCLSEDTMEKVPVPISEEEESGKVGGNSPSSPAPPPVCKRKSNKKSSLPKSQSSSSLRSQKGSPSRKKIPRRASSAKLRK